MVTQLKYWLKNSNSPSAKRLFKFAKSLRNPQLPVIPLLHSGLYHLHYFVFADMCSFEPHGAMMQPLKPRLTFPFTQL